MLGAQKFKLSHPLKPSIVLASAPYQLIHVIVPAKHANSKLQPPIAGVELSETKKANSLSGLEADPE